MPQRSRTPRRLAILAAAFLLAGCGGGPAMGDLSPADFYARFSGDWHTDADAIARARETLRNARSTRTPFAAPGAGGGAMMGGRGRRSGGAQRLDPDTRRRAMEMATGFPERLTLLVRDSAATVVGLHTSALVLPFGKTVKVRLGGTDMKVRARWDGAVLVVERELGLAAVVDRIEPVGDGSEMILTRELALGRVGGARAALPYRRSGG